MTTERGAEARAPGWAIACIGLVAASMLVYEILLTRVCALRLHFHFGYLVVSGCLLGVGASGTLISLFQERWRPRAREVVAGFTLAYLLSLAATWVFLLRFEIPASFAFESPGSLFRFGVFTLVSSTPFFFGGGAVGCLLSFHASRVNTLYAVDLVGAGLGCLATPFLLRAFGAGGCLVFVALLALGGVLVSAAPRRGRAGVLAAGVALGAAGVWLLPRLDALAPVPGKSQLELTREIGMRVDRTPHYSRWSTNSRVDLLPPDSDRPFLFGSGARFADAPLPERWYILQDGGAGTFVHDFARHPEMLVRIENSLYSAALQLRERPRVFIIGAGGGSDVWAARLRDPAAVKAVELNRQIIDIHREVLPDFSRPLIEDPRIEFVHGEGRSALMRDTGRYDVIQMTGIDTWTALASGAYVLAENYLYTREAIESMLEHLDEGGLLQIVRFARHMEALRMISNVRAAYASLGVEDVSRRIALIMAPDFLLATIVKKGEFTDAEVAALSAFTERAGLSVLYLPGQRRDNVVEEFVLTDDVEGFIEAFPRDISPTTDDRPYFFNFHRWSDPLASAGHIGEHTSVSQGNPAFLLGQLGASAALATGFIVLPLAIWRRRGIDRRLALPCFAYFAGLGLGFILIEIALMQKLTLFLGHPVYSLTVTLFSILVFSGIGSFASRRWFDGGASPGWIPIGLAACVAILVALSPWLARDAIALPLEARVAIAALAIAPIGLLLGVPFALGVRRLDTLAPPLVPWAWAINACFTVIGGILTVVISMNAGFRAVFVLAVAIYFCAFAALRRIRAAA